MKRVGAAIAIVAVLGAGGAYLGTRGDLSPPTPWASQDFARPAQAASAPPAAALPAASSINIADIVEQVTPAVVNIQVRATAEAPQLPPMFNDPNFRRFFNIPEAPQARESASVGSGVVVDAKEGFVVTNAHVIDKATEITVTLKDRRVFTADVVGRDPATDIALLKIDADGLHALPVGNSRDLRVGDYVLAVGNPFGLGQTVTSGIVSALGRSGLNVEGYEDFIQTDAPINPGNSGGALINLKGELIGINTAIIGPSGGNVGIGFAVPTHMVAGIMDQLVAYGEVERGRIGVAIQDITPTLADNLDIDVAHGALVNRVEKDSPADKAGLKAGDVVLALNGQDVEGSSALRNRVGMVKPGETVKLDVLRDGDRRSYNVEVARIPNEQQVASAEPLRPSGAMFEKVDNGVRVANVAQNSPAAAIGLQSGDVVTAINRKPVESEREVEQALNKPRGQTVLFLIRDGQEMLLIA